MEGGSYSLHEVQRQLHITGRDTCLFVVWTTKASITIPIRVKTSGRLILPLLLVPVFREANGPKIFHIVHILSTKY